MQITTEQIKELRDQTGVSVMQCKKALEEAMGDKEKALLILKKKSADIASKKSDRVANDGLVLVRTSPEKAIMLVLNCETDFVSRNEDFIKLAGEIADMAINQGVENAKGKAKEMIDPVVQKIGENIQLGDILSIEGDNLGAYVHNNKSGVIASLQGGTPELAKDLAMHISAMKPEFAKPEDIDPKTVEAMKELFMKEVAESDKPEEIKQKMLQGKIDAYFKERTLTEQSFIKNPDMTVKELLKQSNASVLGFIKSSI